MKSTRTLKSIMCFHATLQRVSPFKVSTRHSFEEAETSKSERSIRVTAAVEKCFVMSGKERALCSSEGPSFCVRRMREVFVWVFLLRASLA